MHCLGFRPFSENCVRSSPGGIVEHCDIAGGEFPLTVPTQFLFAEYIIHDLRDYRGEIRLLSAKQLRRLLRNLRQNDINQLKLLSRFLPLRTLLQVPLQTTSDLKQRPSNLFKDLFVCSDSFLRFAGELHVC